MAWGKEKRVLNTQNMNDYIEYSGEDDNVDAMMAMMTMIVVVDVATAAADDDDDYDGCCC